MNQRPIISDISVAALAQIELSDWQFMLTRLEENADSSLLDILYARRQVARIESELNYGTGKPAHVGINVPTLPGDSAYVVPEHETGLTKREYMATAALGGLLAANPGTYYNLGPDAVQLADDLIDALNKAVR